MSFLSSMPIWGWFDVLFNLAVLVALCGESHWGLKRLIPNNSEGATSVKWRREKLKKKFELLLIIGIAGEVGCLPFSLAESANSYKLARQANERTANTESNNLALRSKVIELEAKSKWRTIAPEQKSAFIDLTKNILKLPIRVRMASGANAETESYAIRIRGILDGAGFVETNKDLAIANWPTGLNILWTGTGPELPPIVFLNNISIIGKPVDLQNAQKKLKTYPSYFTNTMVRTEFELTYGDSEPEAYVTDTNGIPILHLKFTGSAPFQISGLQAVQSAFSAIGIQSAWMTSTNIPAGISEIFVNPK